MRNFFIPLVYVQVENIYTFVVRNRYVTVLAVFKQHYRSEMTTLALIGIASLDIFTMPRGYSRCDNVVT